MAKRALITGITGQDGAYLARFLMNKGYEVFGGHELLAKPDVWRLQYLEIENKVNLIPLEVTDSDSITRAIQLSQPHEVYHLAAKSYAGGAFADPIAYGETNGLAVTRLLEVIHKVDSKIRVFNAATGAFLDNSHGSLLTEDSPFRATNPYTAAKLYGYWMMRVYRDSKGIFTCNGILFNHESPLRSLEFVTRKITNAAAKVALGLETELTLGNLNASRDWGYAPEYIEAMWLMLQRDEPDDYVIATNETHSVREFTATAFEALGLDWQRYVKSDEKLFRPVEEDCWQGDYSKARYKLGWQPKTRFNALVEIMAKEDMDRWQRWLKGERFPWDVPDNPVEKSVLERL